MSNEREFSFTQKDFTFLSKIIHERTGIVVSDDKFNMFYSRLSRRVRSLKLNSFQEYCAIVRDEREGNETSELINAITTNLTAFFRENHHFEYLSDTVFPELTQKNPDRNIKLWSAGCSTGEEPYSLAIIMKESPLLANWNFELKATDLDSNVVAKANRGVYSMSRVEGMSKKRLKRWFFKGAGKQQGLVKVKPELNQMIEFGQLNLIDNWSQEPQDVIFCRNVIIYFNKETKAKLVDQYANSLKPGGYLFIGHSESLYKVTDRFELIGNTIYRKIK
ncbi:MAG: protein-glutamate O-methyltransferase [Gammaproteobacteria bacterium]|nr:protein-glutamate O-methyltransferase [Gammaproteobacteria bacterium]